MTSNRSVSEMVERVFTEPVVEQSKRLSVFPNGDAESPATWIMRVRKAAMLDALSSQAQSDDVVERCAEWLTTNVTRIGSDNVQGIAAAMVAEVSAAIPPAGGVEERLREALRPFAAAAQLFTSGVHNGGLESVREFPTAQEWRIAGSLFPDLHTAVFPKAEALRATLNESSAIGGGDGR